MGYMLGAYEIHRPLRVEVRNVNPSNLLPVYIATLEPGELTLHEWGSGPTATEALSDLEASMREMIKGMQNMGELALGKDMLAYKHLLDKYVRKTEPVG